MTTSPPLQCSCGLTDFVDIRFRSDGVMTFTCFQCRKPMQINVPAVMSHQAWEIVEQAAPEPVAQEPEPETSERPERYGYKLGGLL